jgi:hypothetical protein
MYPCAFHSFKGSDVSPVHNKLAVIAKQPGFQDTGKDDATELLESYSLPLSSKALEELHKQTIMHRVTTMTKTVSLQKHK